MSCLAKSESDGWKIRYRALRAGKAWPAKIWI